MSIRACGAGVLVLVLAACGDGSPDPRPTEVVGVVVGGDERTLAVQLGGDGTGAEVTVEETADEVRLSGESLGECPPGAICIGLQRLVHLEDPLGERRLVDATTGEPVAEVVRCGGVEEATLLGTCERAEVD
ncbi:MAG TPA: hypothetical protein VD926_00635 [Acidimicrobiales bacterium]|nr:hypothetical protein [Acidimicrobiales bacterium]